MEVERRGILQLYRMKQAHVIIRSLNTEQALVNTVQAKLGEKICLNKSVGRRT